MIQMRNFYVLVPEREDARLGYTGENLSRRFEIEVDDPGAWAYKLDVRNEAGVANIIDLMLDGSTLYTEIERAVLQVSGKVTAQIRAIDGDKVKCSNSFYLFIGDSVEATGYVESLPPSEFEQLEARLTEMKTEAVAAAGRAESAADDAEAAKQASETAAGAAAAAAADAETSANGAATSETNAGSAAQRAEEARADLEQVVSDGAAAVRAEVKEDADRAEGAANTAQTAAGTAALHAQNAQTAAEQAAGQAAEEAANNVANALSGYVTDAQTAKEAAENARDEAIETAASVGGKRVCRFVVGTSTSGWTAADCDYLCDGTEDNVEIQAAIDALPDAGGEIVVLDGTYAIAGKINFSAPARVILRGNGEETTVLQMLNDAHDNITPGICTELRDLTIDSASLSNRRLIVKANNTLLKAVNCTFKTGNARYFVATTAMYNYFEFDYCTFESSAAALTLMGVCKIRNCDFNTCILIPMETSVIDGCKIRVYDPTNTGYAITNTGGGIEIRNCCIYAYRGIRFSVTGSTVTNCKMTLSCATGTTGGRIGVDLSATGCADNLVCNNLINLNANYAVEEGEVGVSDPNSANMVADNLVLSRATVWEDFTQQTE